MQNIFPEGPVWYAVFLFSITCHEAAHALAARLGGDDTAYEGGQVTLNPLPHMQREPIGTIVVPIISYIYAGWILGWASAPIDPTWQARHPHRAAWMALAGPVSNFLIMLIAGICIRIGLANGFFDFPLPEHIGFDELVVSSDTGAPSGATLFISVLFSLNLLLCVFNLIPLPPLDGATVIGLLFPEETALKIYDAARNPGFQLIGMMLVWTMFGKFFAPIFYFALKLLFTPF